MTPVLEIADVTFRRDGKQIIDGISLTMGELGFVTPWLAAWMPLIAFGLLAAVLTLRAENV